MLSLHWLRSPSTPASMTLPLQHLPTRAQRMSTTGGREEQIEILLKEVRSEQATPAQASLASLLEQLLV
jgi:hypothetical protein